MVALGLILWSAKAMASSERLPLTSPEDYQITGGFSLVSTPSDSDNSAEVDLHQTDAHRWISASQNGVPTGEWISPDFTAPKRLSLDLAGNPNQPGVGVNLQLLETGETVTLNSADHHNQNWYRYVWRLPSDWVGRSVRLLAADASEDPVEWVGISEPQAASWFDILQYASNPFFFLLRYSFHFALIFLPGLFIFSRWGLPKTLSPALLPLAIFGVSAAIGYLTFWIFWLDKNVGIVVSSLVILLSLIGTVWGISDRSLIRLLKVPETILPLALIYLVGLAYLSILYFYFHPFLFHELVINSRFFPLTSPDNILPNVFADRLYNGEDPRPLWAEWQSSDRPPVQAGIFLSQRVLINLFYPSTIGLSNQMIGTILQCSWVAAVWALCRQLNLKSVNVSLILGFCIGSGFFLYNSLYPWPKLLAASLCAGLVVMLLQALQLKDSPILAGGLAGLGAGLGMMAHSGVAFTLIPMLLLTLFWIPRLGLRRTVAVIVTLAIVILPWIGYQKLYEPPGNRLVKWHLAGVIEVDERSFTEALVDEYTAAGLQTVVSNKVKNFRHLTASNPTLWPAVYGYRNPPFYKGHRNNEFFFLVFAFGILNAGWLVFVWFCSGLSQHRLKKEMTPLSRSLRQNLCFLPMLGLAGIACWCLLLFGPATTIVLAGSYATMLLLFVGLGALLTQIPRPIIYTLLGIHLSIFLVTWVLSPPIPLPERTPTLFPGPNLTMMLYAIAATAAIAIALFKISKLPLATHAAPPSP